MGECSNLFTVSPLRFLIVVLFVIMSLRAQSRSGINTPGDSSKIKYDINDPRNPLCPCHEYQKKADEEFAQLQKRQAQKDNFLVSNNSFSGNNNLKCHRSFLFTHKKRAGGKKFYKMKAVFTKEYWRKIRATTDVADCFRW